MSARITLTGHLWGEPRLRLVPTVSGQAAELNQTVETAPGDVEIALGITLVTPFLRAFGTIQTTITVADGDSVVVDFLPYAEGWRALLCHQ